MLLEKLKVIEIMKNVIKFTEDAQVKKSAGQVIKNNELEALRKVVGEMYAEHGATSEVMELNRKLIL
ncbi:hypothetical protein [Tepidibacter formicigenes]|jgi:nitrous oxidase accessory protein NosD|uniref:Uncharacterized protein n=1 Tax=Tepidibacter formicigenes DSM 15518 TaxID=1123349 RepID=A0A1M6SMV4_9FIRM|nr:hypothetical protein [Tepidibacter formicigenes]SHK46081.1 hypothetical protein SAMN02744037_02385 [Tepidibacter formicigenes DSM 15518]